MQLLSIELRQNPSNRFYRRSAGSRNRYARTDLGHLALPHLYKSRSPNISLSCLENQAALRLDTLARLVTVIAFVNLQGVVYTSNDGFLGTALAPGGMQANSCFGLY